MTIFYIDDDAEDRDFFCGATSQIDPTIICLTAADGLEALEFLTHMPELPDYIFLDINMPLMDGRMCLREIRKIRKYDEIPVIMYSTTSNTEEIRALLKLGASDFLIKPNNYSELIEALESIFTVRKRVTL